jgi:RNA polymerase sigma factor (sigma-70 family)
MSLALNSTQPTPTCTEHELAAAVRNGSDRAFEELYARYSARIRAYIAGMVGDHARAEDLAQEVFISALRRLRQTERPIAFKPWIYEIAKNACIDEFRRTRRAREVPLDSEPDGAETDRWLVSSAPAPDAAIERKQSLKDLQGAFHGLSENHHRVIVMRELEGLSYSEIGERLGMTRPVVESTLFRARRRLDQEYNELVSGRRCEQVQALIAAEEPESLLKLGVRPRRQLVRHLAHCQPCRRHARLAGVDDSLFQAPGFVGKIAALLPLPWLRWRRGGSRSSVAPDSDTHHFSLLVPMQNVARFADLIGPSTGFGRAVAGMAAVALAGFGGGIVAGGASHGREAAAVRGMPAPGSHRAGPARAASNRHRSAGSIGRGGTANHSGRSRAGSRAAAATPGGAARTAGRTTTQRSSGASAASGSGHGGGSLPSLSSATNPVSKVLGRAVSGAGSAVTSHLPSLPKLGQPKLPGVTTPSPPASVKLPPLPKVGTPTVTTPTVTTPTVSIPTSTTPSPPTVTVPKLP